LIALLKKFQKQFIRILGLISASFITLLSVSSFSAAWLPNEGKSIVAMTKYMTYYTEFYNLDGDKVNQSEFRKLELKPYYEYGYLDSV